MKERIIGVVGQIGSGKDTATSFLEKKGFINFSLSDQIRIELRKRGNVNFTREDIQNLGDELRVENDDDYWARQAWEKAITSGKKKLIISSIRHPAEAEFLKNQTNFYLLAVIADQRLRFKRKLESAQRKSDSTRSDDQDILTWEEFKKADDREVKVQKEHSQQVSNVVALADFVIENNGTIEELEEKVYQTLGRIEGEQNA